MEKYILEELITLQKVDGGNGGTGYLGQRFFNAVLEFGWDNIKHEIIYDNLTHDESVTIEKEQIWEHSSFLSSKGYNVQSEFDRGYYVTFRNGEKIYYNGLYKPYLLIKDSLFDTYDRKHRGKQKNKQYKKTRSRVCGLKALETLVLKSQKVTIDGLTIEVADKSHNIYAKKLFNKVMTEREKKKQRELYKKKLEETIKPMEELIWEK